MEHGYHIVNLGCKVNRVEADDAARELDAHGWHMAELGDAQLVIVNTCTVTAEAEAKSRKAVRHALKSDPNDLWVIGCDMEMHRAFYEGLDPRIRCYGKDGLRERISRYAADTDNRVFGTTESASPGSGRLLRMGYAYRTRVSIKIQDGCDHACTYCIVHTARGAARSATAAGIVDEVAAYLASGAREIVLTGIDIGAYRDPETGADLEALLRRLHELLLQQDAFCRIRLSSIEPMSVTDGLIELIAQADGRICRHLHLPLQSGSSRVLQAMDRPYTAEEYQSLVERMRRAIPGLALSTDVIVGFPGETDDEFQETDELCQACGFMKLHVFPYSRRAGTPAFDMPDQIDPHEKSRRAAVLLARSNDLADADRARRAGTTEWMLVEDEGTATSESYHRVAVPYEHEKGSLVRLMFPA